MTDQTAAPPADPRKTRADIDKAVAEARSAQAKARADELALAESRTPLAKQQREAEAQQKIAEAEKAAVAAERDQVTSLIPDFVKVERGSLDIKGDQPLFAAGIAGRALDAAASQVVDIVDRALPDAGWRLLVTSDAELASSHAAYHEVAGGLRQLIKAADDVIENATPSDLEVATATIGAIASAIPGLLSLFSAHRTLSGSTVTVDDVAAAAAAAGAMLHRNSNGEVFHDTVRLLSKGRLHADLDTLAERRQTLAELKIALKNLEARKQAEVAERQAAIAELQVTIAGNGDAGDSLQAELATGQEEQGRLEEQAADAAVKAKVVTGVIAAIDGFASTVRAVPEGATRSPLTLAALREHLRDDETEGDTTDSGTTSGTDTPPDPERFSHVLFVKGNGGSVTQTIDDKPFVFKDTFCVVATAGITYMIVETASGKLVGAGNAGGSAVGTGKIGDRFELSVEARKMN